MMLSRSGTFMDTMSSGSNRAGIPSCVSATSNAYGEAKTREETETVSMPIINYSDPQGCDYYKCPPFTLTRSPTPQYQSKHNCI